MKHDRQVALLDRMLELRKRREGQHIYDTVLHLPLDIYTSQDIFEREMETLFSDSPLVSGHIDSVREPDCSMLSDWMRDYGPKDYSVSESKGLVWVHPTRHEPFDPAQDLGAFAEDFAEFHLERFVSYKRVVTEKKANWKLLVQMNLEGYHVAHLHKGTLAPNFREGFLSHDAEGPHLRVMATLTNLPDAENVPKKQRKLLDFVALFYVLFPNTIVIVRKDTILITRFLPLAPDRTLWSQELLYLPDKYVGESGQKTLRNLLLYTEVTLDDEDYTMAERVQANLLNGVNETHMLGLEEGLVMVFQEIVNERLAARDATTADSP